MNIATLIGWFHLGRQQASRGLGAITLVAMLAAPRPTIAAESNTRPNFLILIADDLNWRDLGVIGNREVKTPRVDALARESMHLRGMFTPSPTCSPARHALYIGLFPIRSGAYPNHTMVDATTKSVFTHLNAPGYRTALLGKQHNRRSPSRSRISAAARMTLRPWGASSRATLDGRVRVQRPALAVDARPAPGDE